MQQLHQPPTGQQEPVERAMELEQALSYLVNMKKRFEDDPDTFDKFLNILDSYQQGQREVKEVWDEVSVLFAEHPDLIKDFTYFLPDGLKKEEEKLELARAIEDLCSGERGMKQLLKEWAEKYTNTGVRLRGMF